MAIVQCHRTRNDRGDSSSDDLRQAEQAASAELSADVRLHALQGGNQERGAHDDGRAACWCRIACEVSAILILVFPTRSIPQWDAAGEASIIIKGLQATADSLRFTTASRRA